MARAVCHLDGQEDIKLLLDRFTPLFSSFSTFTDTVQRWACGKQAQEWLQAETFQGQPWKGPSGGRNTEPVLGEAAQTSLHETPLPKNLLQNQPSGSCKALASFCSQTNPSPAAEDSVGQTGGTNWCPGGDHSPDPLVPEPTELFLHLQTPTKRRGCNIGWKK